MWTSSFWRALIERAAWTAAQSLSALLIAGATNILEVNWKSVLGTAALATVISVLKTIGVGAGTGGNASLATGSEVTTPPGAVAVDPAGDIHREGI